MQYYRDRDLASKASVSRSTIWNWARKGLLPKPIKIGLRTTVWRKDETDAAFLKMEEDAAAALAAEQEQPENTPLTGRYEKGRGSKRKVVV